MVPWTCEEEKCEDVLKISEARVCKGFSARNLSRSICRVVSSGDTLLLSASFNFYFASICWILMDEDGMNSMFLEVS